MNILSLRLQRHVMRISSFSVQFKIVLFLFSINFTVSSSIRKSSDWKLNIIHTNDMHSRFEETSVSPSNIIECPQEYKKAGKCYGGFARLATLIRRARESDVPTLFFNAGDTYQGTIWYSVHKWKIVKHFLEILKPDAISLGNHELDDGTEGLLPLLQNATFPTVACNLDFPNDPDIANNINKSIVLHVNGREIGIIGYLTPDTKNISKADNVVFSDEIESIKKEVTKLHSQGVNILIALGHSGFETDIKIATEVEGLDLVIGGHSHTFLYHGNPSSFEKPKGLYPVLITQKSGRKVYVAQAYAFTKYLGNLMITFNADGEIKSIDGNPILVDNNIEQAPDVLEELNKWRTPVDALKNKAVGHTRVLLHHTDECRAKECNLANLVADAMIETNMEKYNDSKGWTDSAIALVGSGYLRASIDKSYRENITMENLINTAPYDNAIVKMDIPGEVFLRVLEHSVAGIEQGKPVTGQFLHFSGLQVSYNLSKPVGSRVVEKSVSVRCAACRIPTFEKLERNKTYTILTSDFIKNGGDGFIMLRTTKPIQLGISIIDSVANYIQRRGTIYPGVEGRIKFVK